LFKNFATIPREQSRFAGRSEVITRCERNDMSLSCCDLVHSTLSDEIVQGRILPLDPKIPKFSAVAERDHQCHK
jgi:hypothetical protein